MITIQLPFYICLCHCIALDKRIHVHSGICDANVYSESKGGGTHFIGYKVAIGHFKFANQSSTIHLSFGELLERCCELLVAPEQHGGEACFELRAPWTLFTRETEMTMSSAYKTKRVTVAGPTASQHRHFWNLYFHLMPFSWPAMPTTTCFWSAAYPRAARDPHLAAPPVGVSPTSWGLDLLLVSLQPNPYSQSLADPNQSPIPAARSPSPAQIIYSQASSPRLEATLASHFNQLFCRKLIINVSLCVSQHKTTHFLRRRGFLSQMKMQYRVCSKFKHFFFYKEKRV